MKPIFEVHLEDYWHAVHEWPKDKGGRIVQNTTWLLKLLDEKRIHAHFYVLGMVAEEFPDLIREIFWRDHVIGSHGYLHFYNEFEGDDSDKMTREILKGFGIEPKGYRSPYWYSTPFPGFCGGVSFRALPLPFLKREIKKSGTFYIHPYDIDEHHPQLIDRYVNWKRHINLSGSKDKLARLLEEVEFGEPR